MSESVVICGRGLVTPLGEDAITTWKALLDGKSITSHSFAAVPRESDRERVSSIAAKAALEALAGSRWSEADLASDRTALVVGTSKGAVETWIPSSGSASDNQPAGEAQPFGLHTVAAQLALELGIRGFGPRLTLSSACATGLHAFIRAAMLLEQGDADRALVVAAESALSSLFIASYRRLGVLADEGQPTRPFDVNRTGFLASEAAAAVCLERRVPDECDIRVRAYGCGADATHLTGSDAAGRTLRRVLRQTAAAGSVDLVHAHGTGTVINDAVELEAIEQPVRHATAGSIVYSHKGALGHSLGAAGLVAVVLNWMAHRSGCVPGNVNTVAPMPSRKVVISQQMVRREIKSSIALAAGFGGGIAAVRLEG